jgi:CHAP domain.
MHIKSKRAGAVAGLSLLLATTIMPIYGLNNGTVYASFEDGNTIVCVPSTSSGLDGHISADDDKNSGSTSTDLGTIPAQRLADAKQIAKFLNEKYGFGENQLASIMATAWRESNWDVNVVNPAGQVKGMFQWSNNGVNGDRIGAAGVDGNSTFTAETTEKILDYEIGQGKNGSAVNMVKAMQSAGNDASKAFIAWALFEGVSITDGQSKTSEVIENSKAVAKVLNTDSMKIDQSKIDKLVSSYGGGSSNANTDTSTTGTTTEVTSTNDCETDDSEVSGGAVDGSGSYTNATDKYFKANMPKDLPSELQQYAYDPRKAGLAYGSSDGWANYGGQCVHFSSSYFYNIWKDAKNMPSSVVMVMYGKDSASDWANAMGGKATNTPKAGAIASVPAGVDGSDPVAGHTFMVQHVFADGGILIAEQNVTGYSGDSNGTPGTWSYRYIPKDTYQKGHYSFFTPEGKPNWDAGK